MIQKETQTNKLGFDNLGEILNSIFEIYKKTALLSGLSFMIISFVLVLIGTIILGAFFDLETLGETIKTFHPDKLSTTGTLIYIGISVLINILISPFIAGILKMNDEAFNNQEPQFSSLYYYINHERYVQIILSVVTLMLFSLGINFGLKQILSDDIGNLVASIVTYGISILTFIALPIVVFTKMNFWEALKLSIQGVSRNFLLVLVLIIINLLLAVVGIFALCVGIIFTLPIIYTLQYILFKKIITSES